MKTKSYIFLATLTFGLVICSPAIAQSLSDPVQNFHQIFGDPNKFVDYIQQGVQAHLGQIMGAFVAVTGFNMVINAFLKN